MLIVGVASLIRSVFGFGESLVAVPLLALIMPLETAVPLSVIVSVVIAGVIVMQDHHKIHWSSAKYLIGYAILGLPFGLLILLYGNAIWVKGILGGLLILYALYALYSKKQYALQSDHKLWLFCCGIFSGIFGGAYGLNGPPLVLYGDLRGWSASHFRATLQAYFLPISLLTVAGYGFKDLLTTEVLSLSIWTLPVVLPAIFLGRYFNHKLKRERFVKYVYLGLLLIGLVLLKDLFL